jgi:DDE superfamily endonuclease
VAKSVLFGAFVKVIHALRILAGGIIKWPNEQEMAAISNGFESMSGIKNIIGAIDGTYVKIDAPHADQEAYINRKCYHSVTLQAICDNRMKFTDCFVGYPSSVHDCRIFRNSPIYKKIQDNPTSFFPQDQFILGDKAYPSLMWCLVPFKRSQSLTEAQTRFNTKHSSARTTIERSFALLFGRFRRLKHLQMKRMDLIPKTIMAACVLHNICLDFPDSIVYTQEEMNMVTEQGDDGVSNSLGAAENSGRALEMRQAICDHLANRTLTF